MVCIRGQIQELLMKTPKGRNYKHVTTEGGNTTGEVREHVSCDNFENVVGNGARERERATTERLK